MKTAVALVISLGIAIVVAAKLSQPTAPPERPAGSWELADTASP